MVRIGRRWKAQKTIKQAKGRLQHSILLGLVAVWQAGLGIHIRLCYDKAQSRESMSEIRAEVEKEHCSKIVAMHQQETWTNWDHASTQKITLTELWKTEQTGLKFFVQAVYDVFPSPYNLHCWGMAEIPACPLCPARGSLKHFLSCCPKALGEGKYSWCHDQVLKAVANTICLGIQKSKHQPPERQSITFVRVEPVSGCKISTGLLPTGSWRWTSSTWSARHLGQTWS